MEAKKNEIENEDKQTIAPMDELHFYDDDDVNRGWWWGWALAVDQERGLIRGGFGAEEEWDLVRTFFGAQRIGCDW